MGMSEEEIKEFFEEIGLVKGVENIKKFQLMNLKKRKYHSDDWQIK